MIPTVKISRRLLVVILTAGAFGFLASSAQAAPPCQHIGKNDPLTEGFTKHQEGKPLPVLTGGTDSEDYWRIHQEPQVNDFGTICYRYFFAPGDDTDISGWTFTMRAKVNRASGFKSYGAVLDSRGNGWLLDMVGGTKVPPESAGLRHLDAAGDFQYLTRAVDPAAGYRTYQMVYNPGGDGGNGSVSYYVDGRLLGTLTRAQVLGKAEVLGKAGKPRVEWGDAQGIGGVTDTQYALIRFEVGQHVISKPSASALPGWGGRSLFATFILGRVRNGTGSAAKIVAEPTASSFTTRIPKPGKTP